MTVRTHYSLTYQSRPWTLNIERRSKWQSIRLTREWREAFCALARYHKIPKLDAVNVVVMPRLRTRAAMPDTGACIGAAKAAIDGLVDAGVLVEDGPSVVRSLMFMAPIVTGLCDELTVLIAPVETEEAA